jgi:drug/metabolite transporter (DMT)-like permease
MWYRSPAFVLVIGIIAVSSASLFIRYAQQEMPSLVVAALRLGFASILMTPWVLKKHSSQIKGIKKKEWIEIILAGLILAIHFATWITSLEYTSVASSVVLVTTTPIWVALLSPIILKEKPGRMTIIGLVVAIIGGVIVSLANECSLTQGVINCVNSSGITKSTALIGNLLALMGAICAAIYLIIGRVLRKSVELMVYVYCIYSWAAIFLVIFSIIAGKHFFPYSLMAFGFCLALAVFPQIVGHTSLNWALAYLPVGLVAIVLLGEPIGSSLLAAIFLKEIPSIAEILGGLTILFGIYLASRKQD